MSNKITIRLEAKQEQALVSVNSFRSALDELITILHEVELELSDAKQSQLHWGISQLSLGSATIGIEDMSAERDLAQRTCVTSISGLATLDKEKRRPEYFNDNALESAQKLARLSGDGVSRISIFSDFRNLQLYVTEQIAVNVSDILEHIEYIGSVEGTLELISGREGQPLYFRVRDIVTNNGVRCIFPEDMLEHALSAFRKRVMVSGFIQSDNVGNPRKIRVQSMEIIPAMESLIQPSDLMKKIEGYKFKGDFYGGGES
jgi:hypothetical protein